MKRFFLFACLCLTLSTISCDKKDEITDVNQYPVWLQTKITELTSEFNLCEMTDVTIIEYKEKRYYHIYCGLWSCSYCQLFDDKGNYAVWETNEFANFLKSGKVIKVLPACP
jgi:thioredoxin-related protein